MEYLKIQSKGEIEPRAFTLIGNSTKRGDASQIGMFGSGLKYAISALLRNRINFQVFSGTEELKFTLKKEGFRGNDFQVICLNGEETSFTASMGGDDWDNPFAPIREIYSNALDEDEEALLETAYSVEGIENVTAFYIEMTPDVKDFYNNIELYFCNKNQNVLFSNRAGTVYRSVRDEVRMFRKGILCTTLGYKGKYDYNSDHFRINESRVLSNRGGADEINGDIWKLCDDDNLILEFLNSIIDENTYSKQIDFVSTFRSTKAQTAGFSNAWETVVRESKFASYESIFLFEPSQLAGRILLPYPLIQELQVQFSFIDVIGLRSKGTGTVYNEIDASNILKDKVIDAISLLKATRYESRISEPLIIKYCRFEKEATLALAENGVIYLATKLDVKSTTEIAKIIIEENEHNTTGFGDRSRTFQNHLFDLYFDELQDNAKLKKLTL